MGEGARGRALAEPHLAGRVRRAWRHAQPGGDLPDGVRPCPRALLGRRARPRPLRADVAAARLARAEGAVPAEDHRGRGVLGSGVQRARGRLGPRRAADARRARRRPVGAQRAEDLDDVRDVRGLALRPVPDEPGRAEARGHLADHRAAPPGGRRHPPDPQHRRRARVLRGVPDRRAHGCRPRRRRGRQRVARRDGNARNRTRADDARDAVRLRRGDGRPARRAARGAAAPPTRSCASGSRRRGSVSRSTGTTTTGRSRR